MNASLPLPRIGALLVLGAALLATGCATQLPAPISGYTCCNLRSDGTWVSRANMQYGPLVPAGTPVRIEQATGQHYFYGYLGGAYVGFRDDTARQREDAQAWLQTLVVSQNPQQQLAPWPPEVQAAVLTSRVRVGMTREQVRMSLSAPSPEDTRDLSGPIWRYWVVAEDIDETVDVHFGADGRVSALTGKPQALRMVEFGR